jgi:hypothetical protein
MSKERKLKRKSDSGTPRVRHYADYYGALKPFLASTPPTRRLISDDAIGRILDAVGEGFVPADLDRSALCAAIEQAWASREIIEKNRPGPRLKKCLEQLDGVHEAANSLLSVLTADNNATELVTELLPNGVSNVELLANAAKALRQTFSEHIETTRKNYQHRIPTAVEWLAGVELPCIYEEFIDLAAGRSRANKSGKPSGPMVRFIAAVLNKAQLRAEDETIVRAFSRLSGVRKRRMALRRDHNMGQK